MKIAGVQMDVRLGQNEANLDRIVGFANQTSVAGAYLTVFPECSLTGYCFTSKTEASPHAESIPGPATDRIGEICSRFNNYVVFGMIEKDEADLFNASVLVGPSGVVATYRKVHLPFLGLDKLVAHGDRPFAVNETNQGLRIGMNICYDASFPEAARCLMLLGADVITLPTNWPTGAKCVAQNTISCRAQENGVYFIAVNRVGHEGGFDFIGMSQACDPNGNWLHQASDSREEVFYAEIDPEQARRKHVIRVSGQHELHRLADRRPEMYGALTQPHGLISLRDLHDW